MPKHYRSLMLLSFSLFLAVGASAREITGNGSTTASGTRVEGRFWAFKFAVDELQRNCYTGESVTEIKETSRKCEKNSFGYNCKSVLRGVCTPQATGKIVVALPFQPEKVNTDGIPDAIKRLTADATLHARGQCESSYNKNKLSRVIVYGGPTDGEGDDELKCNVNPDKSENAPSNLCFLLVMGQCDFNN